MPYPKAHYAVFVVLAVIAGGFWPSYFSVWGAVPWQFHAHGIAASIWVCMVAAQSWTAHHRPQLPLHRTIGKASLFLFPFLIAGLCAIIDRTGKGFIANDDPVRVMLGGSFLSGMGVAIAAYVTVYYRALKYRRQVWVHAGYMLATPLILFESPFGRLLNMFVPPVHRARPGGFRTHPAVDPVVDGARARRHRGDLARLSRQGTALPGGGRLHRRADGHHGSAQRPAGAQGDADDDRQRAQRSRVAYRPRDRRADQLGRMAGG